MQNFIETQREEPHKSEATERLKNFEEVYRFFDNKQVRRQAERCVQCGDFSGISAATFSISTPPSALAIMVKRSVLRSRVTAR